MSISSQSRPLPAQISATSGLPEHTHMPTCGLSAVARTFAKVGLS